MFKIVTTNFFLRRLRKFLNKHPELRDRFTQVVDGLAAHLVIDHSRPGSSNLPPKVNNMARKPVHPGEILADELIELKVSASELAGEIHVPPNRISRILAGKRAITAETALRLGKWFGPGPHIWLNLQQAYGIDLIQQDFQATLDEIKTRIAV